MLYPKTWIWNLFWFISTFGFFVIILTRFFQYFSPVYFVLFFLVFTYAGHKLRSTWMKIFIKAVLLKSEINIYLMKVVDNLILFFHWWFNPIRTIMIFWILIAVIPTPKSYFIYFCSFWLNTLLWQQVIWFVVKTNCFIIMFHIYINIL